MSDDEQRDAESGRPRAGRLLTSPLRWAMLELAWPVLVGQLLVFTVNFFDVWMSGRLGTNATNAVGVGAYVGWLAGMFFSTVAVGTTAIVARCFGRGDYSAANSVTQTSIVLAFAIGLVALILGVLTADLFARLLNFSGEGAELVREFLRIYAISYLFSSLNATSSASMRGAGDMRTPMFALGAVCVLNVGLSFLFVYGWGPVPAQGVNGIAWGTVAARMLGSLIMLTVLVSGWTPVRLSWRVSDHNFPAETWRLFRIGIPSGLEGLLNWTGHFLFLQMISMLEAAAFAAHIIGVEIEAIGYLPAIAWGQAAATMTGQSLGAGDKQRAFLSGWEAALQGAIWAVTLNVVFYWGAFQIYTLMHDESAVIDQGTPAMRLLAFYQLPTIVFIILSTTLKGAGETRVPMLVSGFCVFAIRLPLAYLFGIHWEYGLVGAWIGMGFDMMLRCLFILAYYLSKRWLIKEV